MPRTAIAAVLAMLLLFAPAASARPVDTPNVTVMPERITDTGATAEGDARADHRHGRAAEDVEPGRHDRGDDAALAQEQYYAAQGDQLPRSAEQESVSAPATRASRPPTTTTPRG